VGRDSLAPPPGGAAIAVGTFDGVHLGHRAAIASAVAAARRLGATPAVLTWDRHPAEVLRPEATPPLLTSKERKVELLGEVGVDLLVVLPFDRALSQLEPERFVLDVLLAGLGARSITVGKGWRFGRKAAGDVPLLARLGHRHGFQVEDVPLTEVAGEPVSSTRIRALVAAGDMEAARNLLGRPFDLTGIVERGDRRGTKLGYPTANLSLHPRLAAPPRGVYAGRTHALGRWHRAAVNIGVNPTFGGDPRRMAPKVESHLLDFDADIYDQVVRVELWRRLRDELRFDSVEELLARMAEDVSLTRSLTC
jgi:riboflavin kinase/FMN adenylyltransferase